MGGNNGIGLGNNMPPIVNYPGVGNVGNVGGVQQGGALPNVAPWRSTEPFYAQNRRISLFFAIICALPGDGLPKLWRSMRDARLQGQTWLPQ